MFTDLLSQFLLAAGVLHKVVQRHLDEVRSRVGSGRVKPTELAYQILCVVQFTLAILSFVGLDGTVFEQGLDDIRAVLFQPHFLDLRQFLLDFRGSNPFEHFDPPVEVSIFGSQPQI